jgi:ribosomal protein S21
MVENRRKKGESFEAFLRRFNKRLLQSGKLIEFKKIRYARREPSRNMMRKSALRRLEVRAEREYLKKIGQLPEEEMQQQRRS